MELLSLHKIAKVEHKRLRQAILGKDLDHVKEKKSKKLQLLTNKGTE